MRSLTKDDSYGLAGIVLCSALAWYDEWWQPFWIAGAILLGVWTAVSLLSRQSQD